MAEPAGVDPWYDDFRNGCSKAAHLYATAFERMSLEMGEATALALAPTLLTQIVNMAEAQATQLETMRFERAALERERDYWQQSQDAALARPAMAQNPW
jgi:hypothetical protein